MDRDEQKPGLDGPEWLEAVACNADGPAARAAQILAKLSPSTMADPLQAPIAMPAKGPTPVETRPAEARNGSRPAPLALRLLVVLLAVCAMTSFVGLGVLHDRPSWFAGLRHMSSSVLAPSRLTRPPSREPPASSALLTISSIVPTSGVGGEHVTIHGERLLGPDGYLVATFDGSPVPTSCPSEKECDAVVPPPPAGADEIAVRLRNDAGDSNIVTFHYT